MSVKKIRENLEDLGVEAVNVYKALLASPRTSNSTKAKICASILDRCGAPVLRATITKNATIKEWNPEDLVQARESLKLQEAQLEQRIETLESV